MTRPRPLGPPMPPREPGTQAHPLTFFLTRAQRDAVLRALRARRTTRSRALLAALGIGIEPKENRQ